MPSPQPRFIRIALVLPTEFAYARAVLRGVIAATRERNMYRAAGADARRGPQVRPWQFRIYRGIYGHSGRYLRRWFEEWNPHGIIGQIYSDRLTKLYRGFDRPVVELFESRAESEFPRILPDDLATGELAARHFIERGFRHFAFFGVPWMLWSREREKGFRAAIERVFHEREISRRTGGVRFTFSSFGSGGGTRPQNGARSALARPGKHRSAAIEAWLRSLPRPLALLAANDLWGFELVQVAREAGLHVPEDVAILGVDNEELLCEIAHPPLSSIRIGAEQIGQAAVALMEDLLRGHKPKHIARIPPVGVITRQSTDVLAVEDPDVAAALRHIRGHASEGLSVKELLQSVATNRRTLERRFVSVLGHTPLEEIHRVKLERAKVLLQTDLPIYQVAARCGFATAEYLATSFLKATGTTPTAYRRQHGIATGWHRLSPP